MMIHSSFQPGFQRTPFRSSLPVSRSDVPRLSWRTQRSVRFSSDSARKPENHARWYGTIQQLLELFSQPTGMRPDGRQLNDILDNLSVASQREFVRLWVEKTGFPALKETSLLIENHAKTVVERASAETGIPVVWSGYDDTCSVGRRLALPGSDLDYWSVLIAGTEGDRNKFLNKIHFLVDPVLQQMPRFPVLVMTQQQLEESIRTAEEELLKEQTQKLELMAKVWNQAENPEAQQRQKKYLFQLLMGKVWRGQKEAGPYLFRGAAPFIIEVMRDGKALIDRCPPEFKARLFASEVFGRNSGGIGIQEYRKQSGHDKYKPKLKARIRFQDFHSLTLSQQFTLIRRLLSYAGVLPPYDARLSSKNPEYQEMQALAAKELFYNTSELAIPAYCNCQCWMRPAG